MNLKRTLKKKQAISKGSFLLIFFYLSIMGCRTSQKTDSGKISSETLDSIATVFNNYIDWYNDNYEQVSPYGLGIIDTGNHHYRIDSVYANVYKKRLAESGFFSKSFMASLDTLLIKWDKYLQEEKIEDGPFLAADIFFYEVDLPNGDLYQDIRDSKVILDHGEYWSYYYDFKFVKEGNTYKISSIPFFNEFD